MGEVVIIVGFLSTLVDRGRGRRQSGKAKVPWRLDAFEGRHGGRIIPQDTLDRHYGGACRSRCCRPERAGIAVAKPSMNGELALSSCLEEVIEEGNRMRARLHSFTQFRSGV